MFERDSDAASAIKLTGAAAQKIEALIVQCEADCDDDAESIITGERYAVIAHIIDECLHRAPAKMSTSEKIDRIVTNRWLGLPIFAAIMFGVYYLAISTFGTSMTDWVNDNLFGDGWDFFGAAMPSVPALFEGWLSAAGASDMVISLVCDGIVAGVTDFGFYVSLPNTVEGLVHVSSLPESDWINDDSIAFKEEQGSKSYRLGDTVRVQCTKIDVNSGNVDFALVEEGQEAAAK